MRSGLAFLFCLCEIAFAREHGSTTYSMCKRSVEGHQQSIIVAMETLSESKCKLLGKNKVDQYTNAGWKCLGFRGEESFSCENKKAITFGIYNGKKIDHLTFTNLQKHRSLVAYLNPNNKKLCHEDRDELVSAGITDAICHFADLKN